MKLKLDLTNSWASAKLKIMKLKSEVMPIKKTETGKSIAGQNKKEGDAK